jgi:hypothetical protein
MTKPLGIRTASTVIERVKGKTIADVQICFDDATIVDVEFVFTDGTTLSVLNSTKPKTELAFTWSDRDEDVIREELGS